MSYLDEMKDELRALLDGLDEEQQETVIKWVTKKVYDSWKNGVKKGSGKAEGRSKQTIKKEEDDT